MRSTFTTLIILFLLWLATQSHAQTHFGLSGQIADAQGIELVGATVILLQPADSTLVEYALTDAQGFFKLNAPKASYLLQVSYMGYQTHTQSLELQQTTALGTLVLEEQTELLEAVEVTEERIPIQLKGDTIEYAADAFGTKEHDNVEALLEQLPGVQVGADGTVKAQGETVDRILVDGKTFFGDNPELAMKNLPANAVDNVQVYDRKSDMAEFSGVDDGVQRKTINLTLKADKKHGFFGHVGAGYGHDAPEVATGPHRYQGNASLNYFNPSMRLSTIGAINNINERSFSFADYLDMMGGLQSLLSGGNNLNLEINDDDPLAALLVGNDHGWARTIGGGVNFNWFLQEKTEWNTHYFYNILHKRTDASSFVRSVGLQNAFARASASQDQFQLGHHNVNTQFKHQFDPTQDLRLQLKVKWSDSQLQQTSFDQSLDANNALQNAVDQAYAQTRQDWGINGHALYRKKLKKKGRVLMANALMGYGYKNSQQNNNAITQWFAAGQLAFMDSLSQEQTTLNHQYVYGGELAYVEPIGKKSFLETKLVGMFNLDRRDQQTFTIADATPTLNPLLSSLFQKDFNYQTLRGRFQHVQKAYTFTAEAALQRSFLQGSFSNGQPDIARTFYYPLGGLSLDYKPAKGQKLNIRYATHIKEPQIQQLQPILDNNNLLALFEGNPNLQPAYHHNLSFRYNLFEQFSFTSFFVNADFSIIQQPIVNTQTISENLVTTYRPTNSDVGYEGHLYLSFNRPIKPLGVIVDLGLTGRLNQVATLINGIKNEQLTHNYTLSAELKNRKKAVLDARIGTRIEWNNSVFSIDKALNTSYWNYSTYADLGITIAKKWQLETEVDYHIFADPNFAEQWHLAIWSASISRTFLKADQLQVTLTAHNLLDQALHIDRFNQGETIGEQRNRTLGRYFMLSLRYKITQVGAKKAGPDLIFEED